MWIQIVYYHFFSDIIYEFQYNIKSNIHRIYSSRMLFQQPFPVIITPIHDYCKLKPVYITLQV